MILEEVRNYLLQHKIIYALTILIITVILTKTTLYLFEAILKYFHKDNKNFNKQIIAVVETPLILIIVLGGLDFAIEKLLTGYASISKIILTIIIIAATILFINLARIFLNSWSERMSKHKGEEFHAEVLPLTKSVVNIILAIIGLLIVLQIWGVEVGTLLTSLGVAGVIVGFAFKQTLENVFGGISLIMDDSFHKKDIIQLENGMIGEVMEINLRSTKIRNFDYETIIIPNGQLANSKIINLAQPTPTLRIKIPVSVAYGSDPEKVKKIMIESLRGEPSVLSYPKRTARFVSMGESSINFELFFYIKDYREMFEIKDRILTKVYKNLYEEGIEIPFPIRTIVQAKEGQYSAQWIKKEDKKEKTKSKTSRSSRKKTK